MLSWQAKYKLGIKEIDEQHENFFIISERIQKMISEVDYKDNYDEIQEIIQELEDYTKYHFSFEEALLEKNDYIGLQSHKFEHKIFIAQLKDVCTLDFDNDQKESLVKIVDFVTEWIVRHIKETDAQYVPVLKK